MSALPQVKFRVLIADDHAMVREGLRSLIQGPEFEVIAEAAGGRAAVGLTAEHDPDVVLMDVSMPDMDGLSALEAIKRQQPDVPVLMVSTYENPSYIVRAIAAGAAGYILKGTSREELLAALRSVTAGDTLVDAGLLRSVVESLVQEPEEGDQGLIEPLTGREIEVLALVAQGLTNVQIGQILEIAEGTARTHVQSIIHKLGVSDRTQAAVWAVKHGVVR